MALMVLVVGTVLALLLRSRLSVERPGPSQQIAEMLLTNPMGFGINDVLEENAGHDWHKYVPMVGSVALFILLSNLFGVFPFFSSPTANATVPLACAVITFLYFNWQGLKHHGPVGYAKHFAGPVWWLSPLMFPVEILSTTARLLSLTVRLWANFLAGHFDLVLPGLVYGPGRLGLDEVSGCGRCTGRAPCVDSYRIYSSARPCPRSVRVRDSASRLYRLVNGGRAFKSSVKPLQREPGCTVSGNHLLAANS
jgi:hypothetical protein